MLEIWHLLTSLVSRPSSPYTTHNQFWRKKKKNKREGEEDLEMRLN